MEFEVKTNSCNMNMIYNSGIYHCPYCKHPLSNNKCPACKTDYSDIISKISEQNIYEHKTLNIKCIDDFIYAIKKCLSYIKIMETTINPLEYFDAGDMLSEYYEKLNRTVFFSDSFDSFIKANFQNDSPMFIEKVVNGIKRKIEADEETEMHLVNRCMSVSESWESKVLMYFRFASCINRFHLLSVVRINEILWSFNMWHYFDIGYKYRTDKNQNNKFFESASIPDNETLFIQDLNVSSINNIENKIKSLLKEEILFTGPYENEEELLNSGVIPSDVFLGLWEMLRKTSKSGCYIILSCDNGNDYRCYHDVYVGQSENVCQRVRNHLTGHGNGDVYCDVRNGNSVYIKIICCEPSQMNDVEKNLIKIFNATKSYNKTAGGSARKI